MIKVKAECLNGPMGGHKFIGFINQNEISVGDIIQIQCGPTTHGLSKIMAMDVDSAGRKGPKNSVYLTTEAAKYHLIIMP